MTQRAFYLVMITISLLVSMGCTSVTNRNSERGDLHMRIAVSHMNNGDYPSALRELLEAEKYSSNNPVIQHNLGMTYFLMDRSDLAEPRLKKAVNLNDRYTDARVDLARVLIDRGLYKEAREHLKIALDDLTYGNPGKTNANLGYLAFREKNYSQAEKSFAKAIKLNRNDCFAATYLGRSLFEQQKYTQATGSLDQAVLICKPSGNDEPHYFSALAWFRSGNPSKAAARFREVSNDYPQGKYQEKSRAMLETLKEIQ